MELVQRGALGPDGAGKRGILEGQVQEGVYQPEERCGCKGHYCVGESDSQFGNDQVSCSSGRWCPEWLAGD